MIYEDAEAMSHWKLHVLFDNDLERDFKVVHKDWKMSQSGWMNEVLYRKVKTRVSIYYKVMNFCNKIAWVQTRNISDEAIERRIQLKLIALHSNVFLLLINGKWNIINRLYLIWRLHYINYNWPVQKKHDWLLRDFNNFKNFARKPWLLLREEVN